MVSSLSTQKYPYWPTVHVASSPVSLLIRTCSLQLLTFKDKTEAQKKQIKYCCSDSGKFTAST